MPDRADGGKALLKAMLRSTGPRRDDLTEPDRRRVENVTTPTTDFSKAEKFEAMSGGAGTSIAVRQSG